MTRVRVYTAEGCHLCGPAIDAVRAVCGDDFTLVSITDDEELERRYRTRIPVVEVDGEALFTYEVDTDALREALERHTGAADMPD